MNNLDIKINIKELTHYSASIDSTMDKKTILSMIRSFAYYLLDLYIKILEEEVNSRRYRGKWEPLEEEGYIEYLGVAPSVSIVSLIEDALEVVKIGNYFIVRINPRVNYPDTKIPLVRVVRAIESGTTKFNARPLLTKEIRALNKDIMIYWRGYFARGGYV